MNKTLKTCIASAMLIGLAGCAGEGAGQGSAAPAGSAATAVPANAVNLRTKLESLIANEEDLGLAGKYVTTADITDGKVDEKLVGTWVSADGDVTYIYNEDGTASAEMVSYDISSDVTFTCIEIGGKKIVCEDTVMTSYDTEDNAAEIPVITYSTYEVTDNALYLVNVGSTDSEVYQSYTGAVSVLYRADEQGNAGEAIKAEPVSIETYYGTWEGDYGEFTVSAEGLVCNEETYNVSLDSMNRFTVEKDGVSTSFGSAVYYAKNYDYETGDLESEGFNLILTYSGEDENDKPNLLSLLDDWKEDFGWDEYYYTGTFRLAE